MNLNEVVMNACEEYLPNIEFDLSGIVRRDYDDEDFVYLYAGLLELTSEILQHRGDKYKVITKLESDGSETIEFLSSGTLLSDEKLDLLSSRYAEGETEKPLCITRGGSRYIAYNFSKIGANIITENIGKLEDKYTVSTKIKIP